ncbi:uncharacterized protein LOC143283826 [Babylonia areolata]|uniref:uncharacterized protein LOC143283826 n=1 Tax=Babylonia areolata TaxID=304850 RepID=UPI003FD306C2
MGDFVGPNKQTGNDRLRRRMNAYGDRVRDSYGRFYAGYPDVFQEQRQQTGILHRRWLENNAKKAAKQSRAKDSSSGNANSLNSHRNLVQQRIKQKIDGAVNCDPNTATTATTAGTATTATAGTTTSTTANTVFNADSKNHHHHHHHNSFANAHITGGGGGGVGSGTGDRDDAGGSVNSSTNVGVTGGGQDGSLPQVSVQIVHQISPRKSEQTIQTNVTVVPFPSLAAGPPPPPAPPQQHPGPDPSATSHSSSGNVTARSSQSNGGCVSANPQAATACVPSTSSAHPAGGQTGTSGGLTASAHGAAHFKTDTSGPVRAQCKQEVQESNPNVACAQGQFTSTEGVSAPPELRYDEITDILKNLEKRDDLRSQLEDFDKIFNHYAESREGASKSALSPLDSRGSPGLSKVAASLEDPLEIASNPKSENVVAASPPLGCSMFEPAQAMGAMAPVATGLSVQTAPPLTEPTGPAAETLKQMAAQHQYQHQGSAAASYPHKRLTESPYSETYNYKNPINNYAPTLNHQSGVAAYRGFSQSTVFPENGHPPYPVAKPRLTQNNTAQSFANEGHVSMSGPGANHSTQPMAPSSLQQLQKQVASQFSPSVPMGHVINSSQPEQLSPAQQVQLAAAAAARQMQHQGGVPQGMGVPQQGYAHASTVASKAPSPPGSVPAVVNAAAFPTSKAVFEQRMRDRQQRQYYSRPPPEYKLHAQRAAAAPYHVPNKGMARSVVEPRSPLETMQNMVNQTSPYPTGVKAEGPANRGAVVTPPTSQQQMAVMSGSGGDPATASAMVQPEKSMAAYQHQQQAAPQPALPPRPPSYSPHARTPTPGSVASATPCSVNGNGNLSSSSAAASHPHLSASSVVNTQVHSHSSYTSALMRNQRPPNVNVGPDGLNISQPRTHPGHMVHPGHPHPHADGWHQHQAMMQGHPGVPSGYSAQALPGHMVSARAQGMQGPMVSSGAHQAMQGPLMTRPHPPMHGHQTSHAAMQGHMASGMGMGATPLNPMGQTAAMPPGYSHRPGSTGSASSAMGAAGHVPGHHPMMAGGGMAMNGGSMMMMHQGMAMTQQQALAMRGRGVAMAGPHPHPHPHPMATVQPTHFHNRAVNPVTMQTPVGVPPNATYSISKQHYLTTPPEKYLYFHLTREQSPAEKYLHFHLI